MAHMVIKFMQTSGLDCCKKGIQVGSCQPRTQFELLRLLLGLEQREY